MSMLAVALLALLFSPLTVIDALDHLVSLPLGDIQGIPCPSDASVTQYLGVPYAQPMLGSLRFRPPQLFNVPYPTPALLATIVPAPCGSICRQRWDAADVSLSSENCLFLNIWVPQAAQQRATTGLVPVRVYIHGGVQNRCSASDPHQNGCFSTGTIQVNIQFRTGAMGLLAHPATWAESNTTGNWALMDQQLALRWVQENIAFFGGDPSQVLLFGNSAGGQAVNFHIVAPGSSGLFSAAIAESPPCTQFLTLQQAYLVGEKLMNATGCSAGTPEEQLACLRSLPWAALVVATDIAGDEYRGITMCEGAAWVPPFHPCVDGTVILAPMMESLEAGRFNRVPYLGGLNHDEGREYVQAFFRPENLTEGVVAAFLEEIYPGADPQAVLHVYQDGNYVGDPEMEFNSMADMWTDMFFACPARRVLTAREKYQAPTYSYMFEITPSCPPDEIRLRASHTAELFFVFGLTANLPPPAGDCNFTPAEVKVADEMLSAWRSMAANGYPILANGSAWEQWSEERQMNAVIRTEGIAMHAVDRAARCSALDHARRSSAALYPGGYDTGMSLEEIVERVGVRMEKRKKTPSMVVMHQGGNFEEIWKTV